MRHRPARSAAHRCLDARRTAQGRRRETHGGHRESSDGPWTFDQDHARGRAGDRAAALLAQLAATTSVASAASPTATAAAATQPAREHHPARAERPLGRTPARAFVHKGDAVTKYQWLINVDDTGDPGTSATRCIDRCLPADAPGGSTRPATTPTAALALDPQHLRVRADRGPGRRDRPRRHHGARQPARRQVPDLRDRRRLQDRRRALHRAPGGRQRVGRRDEPHAAAAGDHPDPGLQRQRTGRRDLRGRRRAGAARLHRAT